MAAPKMIQPYHDEVIIEMRSRGESLTDIAVVVGVSQQSLSKYIQRHPDMAHRIARATRTLARRESNRQSQQAARTRKALGHTTAMQPEHLPIHLQPADTPLPARRGTRIGMIAVDTPASAAGFFGSSSDWDASLQGRRSHVPNTPEYKAWLAQREADRDDPPRVFVQVDIEGRETDVRYGRLSQAQRYTDAGYRVCLA